MKKDINDNGNINKSDNNEKNDDDDDDDENYDNKVMRIKEKQYILKNTKQ